MYNNYIEPFYLLSLRIILHFLEPCINVKQIIHRVMINTIMYMYSRSTDYNYMYQLIEKDSYRDFYQTQYTGICT